MTRRQKMRLQKTMGFGLLFATAAFIAVVVKFFGQDADGTFAIITIPLALFLITSKRCWLSI